MTQQPQYPQAYPPVPRPASRSKAGRVVLALVALTVTCFAGVAVGAVFAQPEATSSATTADAPSERVAEPGTASVGTPAKTQAPTIEDGVWTVGTDMPAGTYRATEAVDSNCYWSITKTGTNGSDIVQNGIPGGGRPSVTLKRGQDFETQRCGTWRKV